MYAIFSFNFFTIDFKMCLYAGHFDTSHLPHDTFWLHFANSSKFEKTKRGKSTWLNLIELRSLGSHSLDTRLGHQKRCMSSWWLTSWAPGKELPDVKSLCSVKFLWTICVRWTATIYKVKLTNRPLGKKLTMLTWRAHYEPLNSGWP